LACPAPEEDFSYLEHLLVSADAVLGNFSGIQIRWAYHRPLAADLLLSPQSASESPATTGCGPYTLSGIGITRRVYGFRFT